MTSNSSWRQFQLFDFTPIRDPNVEEPLYSESTLAAICTTSDYLAVASNNSYLKIADKEFNICLVFEAYEIAYRIGFLFALKLSNFVATVAEKQGTASILRLWDINKLLRLAKEQRKSDELKLHYATEIEIQSGLNSFPISCVAINEEVTCIAVGYTDGKVILIRGDILRDRGSRQRIVYEANDPITGLHFNENENFLYVVTTSSIVTVSTSGRNQRRAETILSKSTGVGLFCSQLDHETQNLLIGTSDSLKFYNHSGKIGSLSFEMPKKFIAKFDKNYLLIVSPGEDVGDSTQPELHDVDLRIAKILIIDLKNKHICFNLSIPNYDIRYVFDLWGHIALLSSTGMLYELQEKPLNQQIEIVLQRELFPIAYKLALEHNLPPEMLIRIQTMKGDFMYDKHEYEESIDAYNDCLQIFCTKGEIIQNLDDYNIEDFIVKVITKFKDVSNISNLTKFLYKLYKLNLADNDSVTLLLCCYCKLKMTDNLDKFIDEIDVSSEGSDSKLSKLVLQDLNFKLILNLFNECGYFAQAIKLLYKLDQPNLIVDIQLGRLNQPQQCLKYIKTLPIDELLLVLVDHSKTLLDKMPLETTELLINVFTGRYSPLEEKPFEDLEDNVRLLKADDYERETFTLNSYKSFLSYLSGNTTSKASNGSSTVSSGPTYLPPKPSVVFASFLSHPSEFVIFLEACLEMFDKYKENSNERVKLVSTLLKTYLSLSKTENSKRSDWIGRAELLTEKYITILDKSTLLLISHVYDFKYGETAAQELLGYETSLFRSAQVSKDINECLTVLKKYGDRQPSLYKEMLKFMVSSEDVFERVEKKDFDFVLELIDLLKIATPLEVIQILSINELASVGMIEKYLIDYIEVNEKEIDNNSKLIESYEKESTKNSLELTKLMSDPFVMKNTKCSSCNLPLSFPAVHFKCGHSFHMRCLNESTYLSSLPSLQGDADKPVCPLCVNSLEVAKSARIVQLDVKNEVKDFEAALSETDDKSKVLMDYIGKGFMDEDYIVLPDI